MVILLLVSSFSGTLSFDFSEWKDYMGNPQRTAYVDCNGPEVPEILWRAALVPGGFDTPPFIVEEGVLVLSKDNIYHVSTTKIVLLDLLTGNVLQEFVPVIPEEYLILEAFPVDARIMGRSTYGIYEVDLVSKTSRLLTEIPIRSLGTGDSYPIILMDKIIFPTYPPVCFSKSDFHMIWTLNTILDLNLRPYNLAGDESIVVFVMAEEGLTRLLAVDPSNGSIKWESDPLPLSLWVALKENTIYCGGEKLWAYDRQGKELWHFAPEERIASNIVLGQDAVYIVDYSNHLYKIGLDGTLIWKRDCEVSPWYYNTHLVGAGNILYCLASSGDPDLVTRSCITAFDMSNGTEMWELESKPPSNIVAAPAVSEGILVVVKENGAIVALASDPDLFAEQGGAFLSRDLPEKAIDSYRKAAELYGRNEDLSKAEEVEKIIHGLENQLQTVAPEMEPKPSIFQLSPLVVLALISISIVGVVLAYFCSMRRRV